MKVKLFFVVICGGGGRGCFCWFYCYYVDLEVDCGMVLEVCCEVVFFVVDDGDCGGFGFVGDEGVV